MDDKKAALDELGVTIIWMGFCAGFGVIAFAYIKSWFFVGFPGLLAVFFQMTVAMIVGYFAMMITAIFIAPFLISIALFGKHKR